MAHASFVHLRVHSAYSLSEGAIRLDELAKLCRDFAAPAVAVTDTNNLFGAIEFSHAAREAGVQPIVGCQLALARDEPSGARPGFGQGGKSGSESDPVVLLASVPGIGKVLAARLHHDLGLDTLEDLETAAHDGRLSQIGGIGQKKLAGIIATLRSRLARLRGPRWASGSGSQPSLPSVEELLDVDREYRRKAEAGQLQLIAPRRFNPKREAWLPVLHTERGARHYTALFSNTARAHQLGMTQDWVLLYYDDGTGERQCTVITAQRDLLKGRRIVRSREAECAAYYGVKDASQEAFSNQPSASC